MIGAPAPERIPVSRDGIGDHAADSREVLDPCGAAGPQDLRQDRRAVHRPAAAGLERMRSIAPRADAPSPCRRVRSARSPPAAVRAPGHLPRDRGEHLRRCRPAGHQRRDPPQRALARASTASCSRSSLLGAQALLDVGEGHDGAAALRHLDAAPRRRTRGTSSRRAGRTSPARSRPSRPSPAAAASGTPRPDRASRPDACSGSSRGCRARTARPRCHSPAPRSRRGWRTGSRRRGPPPRSAARPSPARRRGNPRHRPSNQPTR